MLECVSGVRCVLTTAVYSPRTQTVSSRYGCFPLWLLPAMAASCDGYFPLWLLPVVATSRCGYFLTRYGCFLPNIELLPGTSTLYSRYGYNHSCHGYFPLLHCTQSDVTVGASVDGATAQSDFRLREQISGSRWQ